MAELTTVVNELIKGKRVDENLHSYTEGLMSAYRRMAYLRGAMNYFTCAQVYSDMSKDTVRTVDSVVDRLQKLVLKGILNGETDTGELIDEVSKFRDELIETMEVLTSYTDNFQIVEYVLNRVEFRFVECEFDNSYYNDQFEKDIYRYVTNDKDNSVINMKLAQIVGQLPMRLSKNKFFDMLKDAFSLYKGTDKQSVDDFAYMLKTAGTIYVPKGFDTAFPELKKLYDKLMDINCDEIDDNKFREYRNLLDKASDMVNEYADFYVMVTEVINDVYSILLTEGAFCEVNEQNKLLDIINSAYEIIEGNEVNEEEAAMGFVEFEGLQERISSQIFNPESAMEEIAGVNADAIRESGYSETFNKLSVISKLQSASTFAVLDDAKVNTETADEEYVSGVLDSLIIDFKNLFEKKDRYFKRAVMALVISGLPSFFNNLNEFEQYVHVSLGQCTDPAEKKACMSLINMMMNE